jgi:Protein of unknown function (DUF3037)
LNYSYRFSLLRFVYDALTEEFVNVGVVVHCPQYGYLKACCSTNYGRISTLFNRVDGTRFRQTVRYVQDQIGIMGMDMREGLLFENKYPLDKLLARVLPIDDSSLRFANGGVGLTEDLDKTLSALFDRYVDSYAKSGDAIRRDDEEVWRTFRDPFERRHVTSRLIPKRIVAKDYDYEFQRTWKNGVWNLYEPVSFDLLDGGSMSEKANRWVGRATSLVDGSEPFKLFLLLGAPQDNRLLEAYRRAENILHKMPASHAFVREDEAEDFAKDVASQLRRVPLHEESPA